jgi:putative NADH-flavin reductase
MKLTIFGATGGTGQEIVKQALSAGHAATVYVRNPDKVKQNSGQLTVVQGEMHEPDKIIQWLQKASMLSN